MVVLEREQSEKCVRLSVELYKLAKKKEEKRSRKAVHRFIKSTQTHSRGF